MDSSGSLGGILQAPLHCIMLVGHWQGKSVHWRPLRSASCLRTNKKSYRMKVEWVLFSWWSAAYYVAYSSFHI